MRRGQALANQLPTPLPSSQWASWHQAAWSTQTSYVGFVITSDLNSEDGIQGPARQYPFSRHIVPPLDTLSQAVIATLLPDLLSHLRTSRQAGKQN